MRALALALAVATLLASACDNSDIQPNGKHHVLTFNIGYGALGEGLARDVILPRQDIEVRGCAKVDPICEVKVFNYDYDGTTLEADLDPGLRLVEAPLENDGYRMRLACDQEPVGSVGEVRVSIVASAGGVRYADALDIECHRADGVLVDVRPASLDINEASPPRALVAVGAQVLAQVGPWANPGDGQQSLGGLGFTVDDADGAFAPEGPPPLGASLVLDALAPGGAGSVVHAGTIQAPLPVEAVPDDVWTLGLSTRVCDIDVPGTPIKPGSVAVSTSGHTAAGDYVGVPSQGCDFTFTGSDGTVLSQPGMPCFDRCIDAPGGGQLCVSLGSKTACVNVDASGNSH